MGRGRFAGSAGGRRYEVAWPGRLSMALATVLMMCGASIVLSGTPAIADISVVDPAQGGTLRPGDSATFRLTTDAPCVRATGDSDTYVVVTEVAGLCGSSRAERTVAISVLTTGLTPPGSYVISVSETGPDGGTYHWTFAVASDDETTTSEIVTASTTTSAPSTTEAHIDSTTSVAEVSSTTAGTDGDPGEPPPIEEEPMTTTTAGGRAAGPTTTTAVSTTSQPNDDEDVGGRNPLGDPGATSSTQALDDELSGLPSDDLLAMFEPRSEASLDGMDAGFFERMFRGAGRKQVEGNPPAGRWPWTALVTAAAAIAVVVGVLRRSRRQHPASSVDGSA